MGWDTVAQVLGFGLIGGVAFLGLRVIWRTYRRSQGGQDAD